MPPARRFRQFDRQQSSSLPIAAVLADLRAGWGEIGLCLLVLFLYAVGADYQGDALKVVNTLGPVLFSLSMAWGIANLLRRSPNNLWAPLFWYRVAMVTYFGLGALVAIYANEDTLAMIRNFYDYYPKDLLLLNTMLVIFHLLVLLFSESIMWAMARGGKDNAKRARPLITKSNFSLGGFGAVLLIIGTLANLLVMLPSVLGLYNLSDIGQFSNLAQASLLGYFMLTLWSLRNKSGWIFVVLGTAVLETVLGLLEMTKGVVLFPSVMVGLGFVFYRPSLRRMATFAVVILLMFTSLSPIISYARNSLNSVYGGQATPAEIAEIYISYYSDDGMNSVDDSNVQGGLARLSYVNAGVFAMNQYDAGHPGDSLRYAPIIWVPRLIYPDKPYITDVAREFTYAVNGNYNSSSSPGVPAEAYWNLGWTGIVIVAGFLALTLTLWSLYTYIVIEREAWHLFFVVLLGMRVASRLDGAIVADILGPIGLAVLAHIILQLLNRFLPERLAIFTRQGRRAKAVEGVKDRRAVLTTPASSASSRR